jgi:hypothetical protein
MPHSREIEYVIKPDGTVEERVLGVSGPDCEKVTEAIESALGEVVKRERTGEYYNKQGTADKVYVENDGS